LKAWGWSGRPVPCCRDSRAPASLRRCSPPRCRRSRSDGSHGWRWCRSCSRCRACHRASARNPRSAPPPSARSSGRCPPRARISTCGEWLRSHGWTRSCCLRISRSTPPPGARCSRGSAAGAGRWSSPGRPGGHCSTSCAPTRASCRCPGRRSRTARSETCRSCRRPAWAARRSSDSWCASPTSRSQTRAARETFAGWLGRSRRCSSSMRGACCASGTPRSGRTSMSRSSSRGRRTAPTTNNWDGFAR
jgi:hypothetical protein